MRSRGLRPLIRHKGPNPAKREFRPKFLWQPLVRLQERVNDLRSTPQSNTEEKLVATRIDGPLEPAPADQQAVVRVGILHGPDK
jgi:hypothetical protein